MTSRWQGRCLHSLPQSDLLPSGLLRGWLFFSNPQGHLSWNECFQGKTVCTASLIRKSLLLLVSGLCFSPFPHLPFLSLPLWWDTFLSTRQRRSGIPVYYYNIGCETKANEKCRAQRSLWIPGARAILSSKWTGEVSHRSLSRDCCTWSIATLLPLRWSQIHQRISLLPDGAVPGPDPVPGTQSTKNP